MEFEEIYKNEMIFIGEKDNLIIARVSEVQRELFKAICKNGEIKARLKGSFYKDRMNKDYPVVGDYVLLQYNENGDSLIEEICERKSCFSRTDFSGHAVGYVKTVKEQVIAANFDYVFILSSLNHDFNLNRITRYISVALQSGAKPVVVLTKADKCQNPEDYIAEVKGISEKADVFPISVITGYGMNELDFYMESGKTIVFLGSSGVGKSTLVNAIAGAEIMVVNEIREDDSKGRHTTTHRQLIELASGVIVIDTPGIRELGMWDAENGINDTFSDVIQLFTKCKYSNCSHSKELGCAVNQAIEEGIVSRERWKTYCQLSNENEWGKNKSVYTKKGKLENKIKRGKNKKMKFQNMEPKHVKEALVLALEEYSVEGIKCPQLMKQSFEKELEVIIQRLFNNKYGKVAVENGKVIGYLAFEGPWDGFHGNVKGVFSPLGGSAFAGDNRNVLASKLLQEVTADLVADRICSFALSRYAHDEEVGTSFVMNGFGIRCSDAIMKLSARTKISELNEDIRFQELVKDDKREISRLRKELIKHLSSAPTFFPTNITQYDNWFENDRIRVFAAKKDNRVIGYMALDTEAETFVSESDNIYNICGAYVDKEYRNKGIAQQLLEYLCEISEKEGKEYLGVDCETLNPTAFRFWSKYFENYTYSYARRIDERVLGYNKYLENEWN